jgi:hypothetical protein
MNTNDELYFKQRRVWRRLELFLSFVTTVLIVITSWRMITISSSASLMDLMILIVILATEATATTREMTVKIIPASCVSISGDEGGAL